MKIAIDHELNHPMEAVWAVLSNFGDLSWSPDVTVDRVEGEGVGMIRHVSAVRGDGTAVERLDSLDEATHSYAYSIVGKSPLPMADYHAEIRMTALDDGRCNIHYQAEARPIGKLDGETLGKILGAIFHRFFEEVGEKLGD